MVNYQSCILYNYTNEANPSPMRNDLVILNAALIGYCILLVDNLFKQKAEKTSGKKDTVLLNIPWVLRFRRSGYW
jgi:hypothetical protein